MKKIINMIDHMYKFNEFIQKFIYIYTYLFKNKKFFNNLVKSYIIKIVSKIPFASCKNKNLKYY